MALLLQACLFETRPPRRVPVRSPEPLPDFDPLIITFVDDSQRVRDTLFRGTGRPENIGELEVDGLPDSGNIRMEGFQAGRLAYRVEIPWPADTLFAVPRWTPVGKRLLEMVPYFQSASLDFRDGRPILYTDHNAWEAAEYDGRAWNWIQLPANGLTQVEHRDDVLHSDAAGTWLLKSEYPVILRGAGRLDAKRVFRETPQPDSRYFRAFASAMEGENLVVAAEAARYTVPSVSVRHLQVGSVLTPLEERIFIGYFPPASSDPFPAPGARQPVLVFQDGETAMILRGANSPGEGMRLFRRRSGSWDSSAAFPPCLGPALALEGGTAYMACEDGGDSVGGPSGYPAFHGRISLRKHGPAGWEEVGPRDIFGMPAYGPILRLHAGVPYVAAQTDQGFLVARFAGGRWEILVQARFRGFGRALDFDLDEAGTPHVAVLDGFRGIRVVKYLDPFLP